ncbi:MAG: hypothetical protein GJT30_07585 [Geobacter sp.]|nr:hypothetical protein [Geobacter sp.]
MACETELHKMHMCALKGQGNEELIKSLTTNATVTCESCGAVANDPQYVCNPKQMPGVSAKGECAGKCPGC